MQHPSLVVAAAALAAALTACSGAGEAPGRTPTPTPVPAKPAVDQPEGAAKDLRDVRCEADPKTGEWSFTAKLVNGSDSDAEYTVSANVVLKQGSTVVGSKEVVEKVAKGQTAEVRLERFTKPAQKPDELLCVPTTTVKRS